MKVHIQNETQAAEGSSELLTNDVYVFPLTFAQQRLWFLDQLQPNNSSYNVWWSIRMQGRLDTQALQSSLNEIVRRHEVLRTTFSVSDEQPVQIVAPLLHVSLPVVDLQGHPDPEKEAQRLARAEAQHPLDLKNGPLVGARLLRLGQEDHVLLLTMHHIIFDGWSRRILVRELATLYEAFCAGRPSPLPALPLQYADYAVWQRNHFRGSNLEQQLSYWKKQLGDAPASLAIPTDRPRPAVQTYRGAVKSFTLSADLSDRLNKLSRKEGATLFMTLLAGFQALLARYSGQEDIVIGTPIANRNRAEIEGLIGFFANTLVLRTSLSGNPGFRDLLARVKEVALGAYAHQDMPFEKLVEELRPERSLSHNPLFQVLFSLQNAPRQAFELAGLNLTPLEAASGTAKFDISLFMVERPEGLRGRFEYNTDLFDAGTMERMLAHYTVLLEAVVANPESRVSELPLLTAGERQQLLVEWNSTKSDYPRSQCLHQIFETQVERTPDATAVCFENQSLTYRELNERANRLAHYLQKYGIGPNNLIGVYLERSLAMMVALLAVQKSGAAYVPIDPAYPADRISFMLEDAQASLLLTERSLLNSIPQHPGEALCLDGNAVPWANESVDNPRSKVTPEDLLYVIFTSGSTGRPKGVQVPHRAVVNLLSFMSKELHMGEGDVIPALASFAFDMCIPELYLALITGGRVVIGQRHLAANGEELAALLRKTAATMVHATPGTWSLLLEAGFTGKGLKRVIGAEPLPRQLCRRLLEEDESLYNFYGPTETTVWSAFHHFRSKNEPVVVGRPLANTQIYILDQNLEPVPIGVPGEIHIGGDGVTCGYLKRAELTAEKFIQDPFSQKPNAKLYKTGDVGRFLSDGRIEFQGRADNQVKVRGYRIELGEIETVLSQHVAVQECVVAAREDVPGDKRLVGYVVPTSLQKFDAADLSSWIQARLPDYMVPVAWVEMERLPLSSNGKVDRKNLPTPDYTRPELEHEYVAAHTPAEEVIAGIWAEVLKLDQAGIEDDFFELGGHSLLATQVVSRIRQAFQVELPLRALFEAPTVYGLAERVEQLQRLKQGLQAPPLKLVERDQPLTLSFAQQRLWFLDQLEPDNPLYNVAHVVRLTGALNTAALTESLNEIVRRHEALRTSFQTVNGEPLQVIGPHLTLPLAIIDLSSMGVSEREAEARKLAMEEIKRPFNLRTGPLLRASLLKLAEQDHVLVLNTHHIVSDRWSLGVLSQELATLYEAFVEGKPSPLPELPVQYADYALWQRQFLAGEVLEKQLAYWKQQLAGAPASLDLPTDRPRPAIQSFHGAQRSVILPNALLHRLKELSRKEGVTLFMTLLAAFNVLLSRYSGQEDIVVGSPIAGRNREEIEKLIGFFVNTLVLRTHLSHNPTFQELLAQVRESAMGAYAHQDLPFEKLVEELKPQRDQSRHPLFQVMLILQNAPTAGQKMANLALHPFPTASQSSKFDLTVIVAEKADGLRTTFEYNTELFEAATIERMLRHFQTVLEAVSEGPTQEIARLPILTAAELQRLLVEWNDTEAEYPHDLCLHEVFAQRAKRTPERTALVFGNRQITYGELNARSNQLARYLRKCGVGPEVLVGLFVERSPDMLVALLGILKSGGAYVPLDPAHSKERIGSILRDAKASLVLTEQTLAESLPEHSGKVIFLDADWPSVANESSDDLHDKFSSHNLAYVLYTSGSTGEPKGVQIEHRNLLSLLGSMQKKPGFTAEDTLLAVTTLSFDIAGLELYLPLVTGGKVVLASRDEATDVRKLLPLLHTTQPTVMQATPATWRMLLEAGWSGAPGMKILCGGEALPPGLAEDLLPHCAELWNMYGPTETTIWSSIYKVEPGLTNTVPIGRPIDNTSFYILDARLQPVPVGVAGELYIGGEGVARGYLKRPELTSEKFIADPFSNRPRARIYKTGDLARYLPEGIVQFLGRADFQVKVRGFRIELGEIETVLAQHPAVQQAVVAAREDAPGDKRLVAYFVSDAGQDPSASELRAHLKKSLPEYMVPSAFVTLDKFPLTPNGKVDRKNLPAPDHTRPELKSEYAAARTPVEEVVAGIWAEVLKVEQVGMGDNFFDLGGHSLLATQVVSRIRQAFQVELPLRTLFEAPTVSDLAGRIELLQRQEPGLDAPPIRPVTRDQALPLSFAQQRLWILDRLGPNGAAYNIPIALRLTGSLNIDALKAALTQVVRRHEVLRTEYHTKNGEAVQIVLPPAPVPVTLADLRRVPSAEREAYALRLAKNEAEKPFNLTRGAVLRASLLRLAESEHVLLLTVHHIAFDGWSVGALLAEMADYYTADVRGEVCRLPEPPIQYGDFAVWQRRMLQGQELERQLSYWKQQLSGAPPSVDLPLDHPRPAMQTFRGAVQTFMIEQSILDRLRQLSRNQGATLFMTLLAAFNVLLSRYSGQEDLVVGSPIAGRNRPEIEKLIGFFVNTLVLRTDLSGNPSFLDLLRRVRETSLGAYAHQDIPFERLVEELNPERDLSHNPLFQIMFSLQNVPRDKWQLPGVTLSPFQVDSGIEKFDLSVNLVEKANGLKASFRYNTDLFEPTTIGRMCEHFQKLLEGIVANPEERIFELPLLDEVERRHILDDWNQTAAEYPDLCIHELFERQVERTPSATALVYEGERVSYAELNKRANRLASHLRGMGVGPNVIVGVLMNRSIEMVVALFAILKAGGAYLPLDPVFPADRLKFMISDAEAKLVLTEEQLAILVPAGVHSELLDPNCEWLSCGNDINVSSGVRPRNLVYILHTSGSTGRPKGAMLHHAGVANCLWSMQERYQLNETDVFLFKTSLNFDSSVWEIFWSLIVGGATVIARTGGHSDTRYLIDTIVRERVTSAFFVPSLLSVILEASKLGQVASLRRVICGGEKLDKKLMTSFFDRLPGVELHQAYGPTETSIAATDWRCERDYPGDIVPIGRALGNTTLYVLDRVMNPVPIGAAGELYIGGKGVGLGYAGRPDLTSERFLPNPFGTKDERLYRTGDIVRYLADGNLEFLGRIDDQVKIRGLRIELAEIEVQIALYPGIRQVLVIAREDTPGNKRLVAYVVPGESQSVQPLELRNHLKQKLPEYMIPSAFVTLKKFPVTPSGKIDRRVLPKPDATSHVNASAIAPRDDFEVVLLRLWQRVLGIDSIGMADNFFELGGHSLLAVRLFNEIKNVTGKEIPLAALFQGATIEYLATLLRDGAQSVSHLTVTEIQRGDGFLPPFFAAVLPGVNALGYLPLAKHMGADQPFYKLQGAGPRTRHRPYTAGEFEDIAANYIQAMRAVQPEGPYYIGGMCAGARIAFDMARLLEAQGQKVGLLAVFDTWVIENSQRRLFWSLYYYHQRLRTFGRLPLAEKREMLLQTLRNKLKLWSNGKNGRNEFQAAYWPGKNFEPHKYGGQITVFKIPKQPFYYVRDPLMGWGTRTTAAVNIQLVEGEHVSVLREPHVQVLAQKLSACLRQAYAQAADFHTVSSLFVSRSAGAKS